MTSIRLRVSAHLSAGVPAVFALAPGCCATAPLRFLPHTGGNTVTLAPFPPHRPHRSRASAASNPQVPSAWQTCGPLMVRAAAQWGQSMRIAAPNLTRSAVVRMCLADMPLALPAPERNGNMARNRKLWMGLPVHRPGLATLGLRAVRVQHPRPGSPPP